MKKIILASQSPRRKELLKMIGLEFRVVPSSYEENHEYTIDPKELVEYLSFQKAQDVALKHPDSVVIAADTIVVLGKKIIGKPKHKKQAREFLTMLSGRMHRVLTGYTIIAAKSAMRKTKVVESKVYFKSLTEKQIQEYVKTGEPLDKAGAYGIQGLGSVFIDRVEGDYFNVVGLPIYVLQEDLKLFGLTP